MTLEFVHNMIIFDQKMFDILLFQEKKNNKLITVDTRFMQFSYYNFNYTIHLYILLIHLNYL